MYFLMTGAKWAHQHVASKMLRHFFKSDSSGRPKLTRKVLNSAPVFIHTGIKLTNKQNTRGQRWRLDVSRAL